MGRASSLAAPVSLKYPFQVLPWQDQGINYGTGASGAWLYTFELLSEIPEKAHCGKETMSHLRVWVLPLTHGAWLVLGASCQHRVSEETVTL